MNKAIHIVVTITFAFACLGLWAILTVVGNSLPVSQTAPAFTRLFLGLSPGLLFLPLLPAIYCLVVLFRKSLDQAATTLYMACAMAVVFFVAFPVILASLLPFVVLMQESGVR